MSPMPFNICLDAAVYYSTNAPRPARKMYQYPMSLQDVVNTACVVTVEEGRVRKTGITRDELTDYLMRLQGEHSIIFQMYVHGTSTVLVPLDSQFYHRIYMPMVSVLHNGSMTESRDLGKYCDMEHISMYHIARLLNSTGLPKGCRVAGSKGDGGLVKLVLQVKREDE